MKRREFLALTAAALLSARPGFAAPAPTKAEAIEQASRQLDLVIFRIRMFHHEARSSLLSSLELPIFQDYFRLKESAKNRYDRLGKIQLTEAQDRMRRKGEEWVQTLFKRFPIGEACLIDSSGQEHLRVSRGKVENPVNFSSEEADAPFFKPTLDLAKGGTFISPPYMSPDVNEWVSAFTAPVVLDDGSKPGIFHFEVPLAVYQNILVSKDFGFTNAVPPMVDAEEEGRFFIVDGNGLLIADSRGKIAFELKAERHPDKNPKLADYQPPERLQDYLPPVASISREAAFIQAVQKMQRGEEGAQELTLAGRPYVLLYRRMPDRPWAIGHLDPIAGPGFWETPKR